VWFSAFTSVRSPAYPARVFYLAEFYLPGGTSLAGIAARARAGAQDAARTGADVRFVRAIFVPRDENCFVLYQASSAQAVSTAGTLAGLVFDRIAEAVTVP
jgi:Protein of unknown function (DUF4242)